MTPLGAAGVLDAAIAQASGNALGVARRGERLGVRLCAGELGGIVRADDPHATGLLRSELPQPILVPSARDGIDLGEALEEIEPGGTAARGAVDLALEELGVACVKQPAIAALHRHARMTARVTGERHQQDLRRNTEAKRHDAAPETAGHDDIALLARMPISELPAVA